jgi:hypothetical protein
MPNFGFGGTLNVGGFTISDMTNISGPGMSADTIDSTTHNSTSIFREFIKGLIDAGELSVDAYFDYDSNGYTCSVLMATRTLQSVTFTMPTTPSKTQFVCNGHITGYEPTDPLDDLIGLAITIKVSGQPTIAKI